MAGLDEIRSTADMVQTLGIAVLVLVSIAVAMRIYVRVRMIKQFGVQDWAMMATYLCILGHVACVTASARVGLLVAEGHLHLLDRYNSLFRASGAFYTVTLVTLKISVCFFFLQIFSYRLIERIIIYVIMVLSTLLGLAYLPLGSFTCSHFRIFLGIITPCPVAVQKSTDVIFVMFSVVNIIGDFAFTCMACFALVQAKLPLPTKFSACLLLCLGSIGGVASAVRLGFFLNPPATKTPIEEARMLYNWVLIEISIGSVAANLALTRPLFHAALTKMGLLAVPTATAHSERTPATRMSRTQHQGHSEARSLGYGVAKIETVVQVVEEEQA